MNLLEKTKKIKKLRTNKFIYSNEFEQVALAWCRDEITLAQICKAMKLDNTGYRLYSRLALTLKEYLNKNYKIKQP